MLGSTEIGALQLLQKGWVQRCKAVVKTATALTCTPQRLSLRILCRLLTLCDDRDEEGLKAAVAVIGDIAKIAQGCRLEGGDEEGNPETSCTDEGLPGS